MAEPECLTRMCKALIPTPQEVKKGSRGKEERKGKKKEGQRKEGNLAWVC